MRQRTEYTRWFEGFTTPPITHSVLLATLVAVFAYLVTPHFGPIEEYVPPPGAWCKSEPVFFGLFETSECLVSTAASFDRQLSEVSPFQTPRTSDTTTPSARLWSALFFFAATYFLLRLRRALLLLSFFSFPAAWMIATSLLSVSFGYAATGLVFFLWFSGLLPVLVRETFETRRWRLVCETALRVLGRPIELCNHRDKAVIMKAAEELLERKRLVAFR